MCLSYILMGMLLASTYYLFIRTTPVKMAKPAQETAQRDLSLSLLKHESPEKLIEMMHGAKSANELELIYDAFLYVIDKKEQSILKK